MEDTQQNSDIPDQTKIQPPKKWWKKSFNFFGKTIPLSVVLMILMAGTGLALLSVFITITGSVNVQQAVTLNAIESTWKHHLIPFTEFPNGGETEVELSTSIGVGGDEQDIGIKLSNYAEVEAPIIIKKTVNYEGPNFDEYDPCTDDTVEVWTGYTPTEFNEVGDGTANWDILTVNSDPNAAKLYVLDGSQDMAAVTMFIEGGIPLNEISELKFFERIASYTPLNGWSVNVILGVDSDNDGTYESNDLGWHIGFPHAPGALGGDTFLEMDGTTNDPATGVWVNTNAYTTPQWWTPNPGGNGLSSDCYETLPNIFSAGCIDKKANLEPTDKVMVIRLVIGGAGSWMDETAYVDDINLNGYTWNLGEACYGEQETVVCNNDVSTTSVTLPPRPDVNNQAIPSETWYCVRDKWHVGAVPGEYDFTIEVIPD